MTSAKKIVSIAYDAQTFYRTDIQFSDELPISERTVLPKPWSENFNEVFNWEIGEKTSLIAIRPFLISLTYPETVSAVPGQECKLTLKLCNTSKVPMKGKVSFRLLDGWKIICPQPKFDLAVGESTEIPFRLFISVPRRRVNLNLLSIDLEANGVITTLEAGIPLTKRWKVTDLTDKKEFFTETPGNHFMVPAGKYVYRTFVTAASNRSAKISANGTGSFRLFLNGKEIIVSNGDCYVASFHREGNWEVVELSMNKNEILVEFDNDTETEFFMEFGTLYACGTWLDSIEFTTEGM